MIARAIPDVTLIRSFRISQISAMKQRMPAWRQRDLESSTSPMIIASPVMAR